VNWYDNIENENRYSTVQDATFEEKQILDMRNYPKGMIKAAKAMKSGYFENLFSKKMNILKGAIVGGLLGSGLAVYTKRGIKGFILFACLGLIGGGISGSMINLKNTPIIGEKEIGQKENLENKTKIEE